MTKGFKIVLAATALFMAGLAFGQDVAPAVPTADEWDHLYSSLNGMKGIGGLGIVAVIVQGLMLLLRSQFGSMAGHFRLLALSALTLAGGVLALRMQGLAWPAVLMHSGTLIAGQVFVHQMWTQINAAPAKPVDPAPAPDTTTKAA